VVINWSVLQQRAAMNQGVFGAEVIEVGIYVVKKWKKVAEDFLSLTRSSCSLVST
jgi:hypothetical protein